MTAHIYIKVKNCLYFIFVVLSCLLSSCGGDSVGKAVCVADTLCLRYAEHLSMVRHGDYTVVTLANPWKPGAVLRTYVLVAREDSGRVGTLPPGTVVYVPVTRSVVFTSPHGSVLCWLGASDAIKGVCDLKYMNNDRVREGVARGDIVDCGDAMAPSVEKVAGASPQTLLLSPFENAGYGKLERLGVPIVECADYMETSALGRAEWIRFYGMLFGRERQADSIFNVVDSCYGRLRALAATSRVSRSILTERKTGGVWYCPGGRSSMGRLIADARGRYAFSDDGHSGSLSLAPEQVLDRAGDADVWIFVNGGRQPMTKDVLLSEYSGYSQIKAFRTGEIYECRTLSSPYFDELSFHPDYLLRDLVALLHPDVMPGDSMRYYKKVSCGMPGVPHE